MKIDKNGLNPVAIERLNASIQRDIESGVNIGASIIVARGGEIAHAQQFGVAAPDRSSKADDRYLMMSLSKSFTAALVLMAIDEGRFALNTKVVDLLPEFGALGKQNITIHMLLTHTGGTYAGLAPLPGMSLADIGNLEKLTAALCAQPVAFTPGSRCHYNSFGGICLLGQILVLTDPKKRSFAKIAREDLFEPLGMTDMHFGNSENDPRRVPVSFGDRYTGPSNAGVVAVLTAPMNGELCEVPAGNAFGTTMDVYRFTQLIRGRGTANGHRLISPALFDYAAKNHTGTMLNDAWDFECVARQIPPMVANFSLLGGYARGEGHSITAMGYSASNRAVCAVGGGSTMWMFDPERDLSFVFLSAGLVEGLAHLERLSRLSDLALAACD